MFVGEKNVFQSAKPDVGDETLLGISDLILFFVKKLIYIYIYIYITEMTASVQGNKSKHTRG